MMKTFSYVAILLAGASACASGTAYAQTATNDSRSAAATQPVLSPSGQQTPSNADPVADTSVARPPDAASHADQGGDIVVTGSRTIRNGNTSPSPVTVVASQDLLRAQPGGTIADALNVLPVFAGSRGPASNPSTTGTAAAGNGGANQLNLRNLGSNRTLVLLDGYRVPPTTANGIVDADLIPQLLVQRVDVVTGGVSAVYGSDAVSGVVNYILDKKFSGISLAASSGISERGDAAKKDIGIAVGTSPFGGRGHFEASYEYIDEGGINRRSDRSYLNKVGVAGSVVGSTAAAGTAGGRVARCLPARHQRQSGVDLAQADERGALIAAAAGEKWCRRRSFASWRRRFANCTACWVKRPCRTNCSARPCSGRRPKRTSAALDLFADGGWSMTALADALGVVRPYLSVIGSRPPPRPRAQKPLPNADLVTDIRALVADLPTYDYCRVHTFLLPCSVRQRRQGAQRPIPSVSSAS